MISIPTFDLQQNIIEDKNKNFNEKIKENANSFQKDKQKRRSRHYIEGRKFECESCHKSYLSKSSLLNHLFQKHPDIIIENNINKRRRGRPKKYEIYQKIKEEKSMNKYKNFYKDSYRSNDGFIIPNNYEKAVYSVFLIYKDFSTKKFFKFLKKPVENPILYNLLIKKNYNNGIFFPVCDDIFSEYLMFFHPMTNEKYFIFVLKFILLFRESINLKMKSEEKYVFIEYTSLENANCIPNFCNDFFSCYLSQNYFGYCNSDIEELIELIQHFCKWLLIKKYTFVKLDLMS